MFDKESILIGDILVFIEEDVNERVNKSIRLCNGIGFEAL